MEKTKRSFRRIGFFVGVGLISGLEIMFRVVPTTKDISMISLIYTVLNTVVPNMVKKEDPDGKKITFDELKEE